MEELFEHGSEIPQFLIDEIMELPREELIEDLEAIIEFSITHFDAVSYEVIPEEKTYYVSHAIYLLADLNAVDSLPAVLEVFKQTQEYNDFYFGDLISEITWDPLMRLGINQLEKIFDYLRIPDLYTYSRTVFIEVLEQIILHYPDKEEEVIKRYEELLIFYLSSEDKSIVDIDLIGLTIWSLMDLRVKQLEPQICALFDKDYINTGIIGTKEEVLERLKMNVDRPTPKELMSLTRRYTELLHKDESFAHSLEGYDSNIQMNNNSNHFSSEPKTQRNNPCPCGSGKKYKKCCLNK
jgi:uncharacterized protein YchJ